MASPENPQLHESSTDVHDIINQRLKDDGLDPHSEKTDKLLYVWKLYQQTEELLQRAVESEEKVKAAQTEEMQEVENYVEHIRNLSDERETLIQELETENEQLRADVDQLKQDQPNSALISETSEMLTQQGLEDIANASSSEQIAYLLVERARLLDELEMEQTQNEGQNSEELKQILERERADFEEDLMQQRESATVLRDSLKVEHEEEINALIDENAKIEEELIALKEKIKELTSDGDKLRDEILHEQTERKKEQETLKTLEKEMKDKEKESPRIEMVRSEVTRSPSPGLGRTTTDVALRKVIEEKTKIEGEIVTLRSRIRTMENEVCSKDEQLSKMSSDLEKGQMIQQQLQIKNKNLRKEVEEMELQLDEAEISVEKMTNENEEFSKKLETVQAELKTLRNDSQKASTLQDIVDILNNEKSQLNNQLESLSQELKAAKSDIEELTNQNHEHNQNEEELTNQIDSLNRDIEEVKDENRRLTNERERVTETQTELSELLQTQQKEIGFMKADKVSMENDADLFHKEKKELLNKVEKFEEDLEKSRKENQDLAKQEIILNHMREQNQKLTSQVSDLQTELNDVKVREGTLIQTQKALDGNREDSDKRYRHELDDLRAKLQMSLQELQKIKTTFEQERSDKNTLQEKYTQLEKSVEETSHLKKLLEEEKKSKSDAEMTIQELKLRLADRSMVAEGFEDERKQRIELEGKMFEFNRMDKELQEVKEQGEELRRQKVSLEDKVRDLEEEVEELRREKVGMEDKVRDLEEEVEELRREKVGMEDRVQDLEQMLEDQKVDTENLQQSMVAKVKSLDSRVIALQDDLFAAQDELQAVQEKYDTVMKENEQITSKLTEPSQRLQSTADQSSNLNQDDVDSKPLVSTRPPIKIKTQSAAVQTDPEIQPIKTKTELSAVQTEQEIISSKQPVLDSKPLDSESKQLEAKLHEALLALQGSNTRVQRLEQELLSSSLKVEQTQNLCRVSEQKLERSEGDLKQVKNQLNEAQSALDVATAEVEDLQKHADLMNTAHDSLELQLELTKTSLQYDGDERQQHVDRIQTLETLSRQLELDNREMAKKLSETMAENNNLVIQLQSEKKRNSDRHDQNRSNVDQLESDLDTAYKQIQQLREDVHGFQTQVFKLKANEVGLEAKHESAITRLEMELKEAKTFHRQELNSLNERLQLAQSDAGHSRETLGETEEELLQHQGDISRMRSTIERLESQLQTETKLRTDYENRNTSLDQEMTKVWSQIRTLMEKNANLENTKRSLEDELDRRSINSRQAEHIFTQTSANQESANKSLRNRAETAEQSASKLQRELQEVTAKMHKSEESLGSLEYNSVELQDKKDQLVQLRNQLEGEKLQRTLLDQTVAELKHQVSLLKHREGKLADDNQSLQHTILDLESRLGELQDQNDQAYHVHHQLSEVGQKSLLEQIARLQKEVKDLQFELITNNEQHSFEQQRYMDRKHRTKEKLLRARDFYSHERSRFQEQMSLVDEDLQLTRATLRKELEWKDKMDVNYKHLLQEKRGLITQLTEHEEILRDRNRSYSMLQIRTKFLEEENSRLQDRIDSLSQDKQYLDQTLKDLQHDRNRELHSISSPDMNMGSFAVTSSGLGNSLKSSWDQERLRECVLDSDTAVNVFHSRIYNEDHINLRHSVETASNQSMDDEFDA